QGRLFVADTGNNRVQVLDEAGAPLRQLRRWGWFSGFRNPRGLALDAEDRLAVADSGNDCVRLFDFRLRFVRSIGRGQLKHPVAVVWDAEGRLFVADFG